MYISSLALIRLDHHPTYEDIIQGASMDANYTPSPVLLLI